MNIIDLGTATNKLVLIKYSYKEVAYSICNQVLDILRAELLNLVAKNGRHCGADGASINDDEVDQV